MQAVRPRARQRTPSVSDEELSGDEEPVGDNDFFDNECDAGYLEGMKNQTHLVQGSHVPSAIERTTEKTEKSEKTEKIETTASSFDTKQTGPGAAAALADDLALVDTDTEPTVDEAQSLPPAVSGSQSGTHDAADDTMKRDSPVPAGDPQETAAGVSEGVAEPGNVGREPDGSVSDKSAKSEGVPDEAAEDASKGNATAVAEVAEDAAVDTSHARATDVGEVAEHSLDADRARAAEGYPSLSESEPVAAPTADDQPQTIEGAAASAPAEVSSRPKSVTFSDTPTTQFSKMQFPTVQITTESDLLASADPATLSASISQEEVEAVRSTYFHIADAAVAEVAEAEEPKAEGDVSAVVDDEVACEASLTRFHSISSGTLQSALQEEAFDVLSDDRSLFFSCPATEGDIESIFSGFWMCMWQTYQGFSHFQSLLENFVQADLALLVHSRRVKADLDIMEKMSQSVWRIEQLQAGAQGTCGHGNVVQESNMNYRYAVLAESPNNASEGGANVADLARHVHSVQHGQVEAYAAAQFRWSMAKTEVDIYLEQVAASSRAFVEGTSRKTPPGPDPGDEAARSGLCGVLVVLFHYERFSTIKENVARFRTVSVECRNALREWIRRAASRLVYLASWTESRFLLQLLLHAPECAEWAIDLFQFPPPWDSKTTKHVCLGREEMFPYVDHFLICLRMMMHAVPKVWVDNCGVTPDGHVSLHTPTTDAQCAALLTEDDIIALFDHLPWERFLMYVLSLPPHPSASTSTSTTTSTSTSFSGADGAGLLTNDPLAVLGVANRLIELLGSPSAPFLRYDRFSRLRGQIVAAIVDNVSATICPRAVTSSAIQNSLDAFYVRATSALMTSPAPNAVWASLAAIQFRSISPRAAWRAFQVLFAPDQGIVSGATPLREYDVGRHRDLNEWLHFVTTGLDGKIRQRFWDTLVGFRVAAEFLIQTLGNVAIATSPDDDDASVLVSVISAELFFAGYVSGATRVELNRSVVGVLSDVAATHPHVVSTLLDLISSNFSYVGRSACFLFSSLPLVDWEPAENDIALLRKLLLCDPSSNESRVVRHIISQRLAAGGEIAPETWRQLGAAVCGAVKENSDTRLQNTEWTEASAAGALLKWTWDVLLQLPLRTFPRLRPPTDRPPHIFTSPLASTPVRFEDAPWDTFLRDVSLSPSQSIDGTCADVAIPACKDARVSPALWLTAQCAFEVPTPPSHVSSDGAPSYPTLGTALPEGLLTGEDPYDEVATKFLLCLRGVATVAAAGRGDAVIRTLFHVLPPLCFFRVTLATMTSVHHHLLPLFSCLASIRNVPTAVASAKSAFMSAVSNNSGEDIEVEGKAMTSCSLSEPVLPSYEGRSAEGTSSLAKAAALAHLLHTCSHQWRSGQIERLLALWVAALTTTPRYWRNSSCVGALDTVAYGAVSLGKTRHFMLAWATHGIDEGTVEDDPSYLKLWDPSYQPGLRVPIPKPLFKVLPDVGRWWEHSHINVAEIASKARSELTGKYWLTFVALCAQSEAELWAMASQENEGGKAPQVSRKRSLFSSVKSMIKGSHISEDGVIYRWLACGLATTSPFAHTSGPLFWLGFFAVYFTVLRRKAQSAAASSFADSLRKVFRHSKGGISHTLDATAQHYHSEASAASEAHAKTHCKEVAAFYETMAVWTTEEFVAAWESRNLAAFGEKHLVSYLEDLVEHPPWSAGGDAFYERVLDKKALEHSLQEQMRPWRWLEEVQESSLLQPPSSALSPASRRRSRDGRWKSDTATGSEKSQRRSLLAVCAHSERKPAPHPPRVSALASLRLAADPRELSAQISAFVQDLMNGGAAFDSERRKYIENSHRFLSLLHGLYRNEPAPTTVERTCPKGNCRPPARLYFGSVTNVVHDEGVATQLRQIMDERKGTPHPDGVTLHSISPLPLTRQAECVAVVAFRNTPANWIRVEPGRLLDEGLACIRSLLTLSTPQLSEYPPVGHALGGGLEKLCAAFVKGAPQAQRFLLDCMEDSASTVDLLLPYFKPAVYPEAFATLYAKVASAPFAERVLPSFQVDEWVRSSVAQNTPDDRRRILLTAVHVLSHNQGGASAAHTHLASIWHILSLFRADHWIELLRLISSETSSAVNENLRGTAVDGSGCVLPNSLTALWNTVKSVLESDHACVVNATQAQDALSTIGVMIQGIREHISVLCPPDQDPAMTLSVYGALGPDLVDAIISLTQYFVGALSAGLSATSRAAPLMMTAWEAIRCWLSPLCVDGERESKGRNSSVCASESGSAGDGFWAQHPPPQASGFYPPQHNHNQPMYSAHNPPVRYDGQHAPSPYSSSQSLYPPAGDSSRRPSHEAFPASSSQPLYPPSGDTSRRPSHEPYHQPPQGLYPPASDGSRRPSHEPFASSSGQFLYPPSQGQSDSRRPSHEALSHASYAPHQPPHALHHSPYGPQHPPPLMPAHPHNQSTAAQGNNPGAGRSPSRRPSTVMTRVFPPWAAAESEAGSKAVNNVLGGLQRITEDCLQADSETLPILWRLYTEDVLPKAPPFVLSAVHNVLLQLPWEAAIATPHFFSCMNVSGPNQIAASSVAGALIARVPTLPSLKQWVHRPGASPADARWFLVSFLRSLLVLLERADTSAPSGIGRDRFSENPETTPSYPQLSSAGSTAVPASVEEALSYAVDSVSPILPWDSLCHDDIQTAVTDVPHLTSWRKQNARRLAEKLLFRAAHVCIASKEETVASCGRVKALVEYLFDATAITSALSVPSAAGGKDPKEEQRKVVNSFCVTSLKSLEGRIRLLASGIEVADKDAVAALDAILTRVFSLGHFVDPKTADDIEHFIVSLVYSMATDSPASASSSLSSSTSTSAPRTSVSAAKSQAVCLASLRATTSLMDVRRIARVDESCLDVYVRSLPAQCSPDWPVPLMENLQVPELDEKDFLHYCCKEKLILTLYCYMLQAGKHVREGMDRRHHLFRQGLKWIQEVGVPKSKETELVGLWALLPLFVVPPASSSGSYSQEEKAEAGKLISKLAEGLEKAAGGGGWSISSFVSAVSSFSFSKDSGESAPVRFLAQLLSVLLRLEITNAGRLQLGAYDIQCQVHGEKMFKHIRSRIPSTSRALRDVCDLLASHYGVHIGGGAPQTSSTQIRDMPDFVSRWVYAVSLVGQLALTPHVVVTSLPKAALL